MDVTDEAQVEAGTEKTVAAFGSLDVLVNNAGIQIVAPLVEFEFAKWKDAPRDTPRRCIPHHPCRPPSDVQAEERQRNLHGFGSFQEASKLKAPYVTPSTA